MQFMTIRVISVFTVIVACALSCGFSILAANDQPLAGESPSEESQSKSGEKPDVTPDAEGFYGVPDAVIDDPDGYVNLRKEKNADSPIIAKVKKDEPFEYQCTQNATWCKVKLASGVTGWMHYSRIKRYYTENDLPKGPEDSGEEIDEQTRKKGVNYYEVARAAARGDKKALKTFLTLGLGGAAEETAAAWAVEHLRDVPKVAFIAGRTAPVSVQEAAFAKLYAEAGTSPWAPYDGC